MDYGFLEASNSAQVVHSGLLGQIQFMLAASHLLYSMASGLSGK
jgi:hypothetical protein